MHSRSSTIARIVHDKIVAVVRLRDAALAPPIIDAIAAGGIGIIEITLTTPGALDLIGWLSRREDLLVGAGTVLDITEAEAVFDAGATFYASPIFDAAVVDTARRFDRVAMPGALTPTEIWQAHRGGADLIKIFPMPEEGVRYIRSLRAPLPDIPIAPSGGVDLRTAPLFLRAGATALNVGSSLTHAPDGTMLSRDEIMNGAAALKRAVEAMHEP